jgi:hypothetical protein
MLGAYWGATYYLLKQISSAYPAWQCITHEILCRDPEVEFRALCNRLGLGNRVIGQEKDLHRFLSAHDRRRTADEGVHSVARPTALEPDKWRRKLRPEQIQAVLAGAEPFDLLAHFFPEEQG